MLLVISLLFGLHGLLVSTHRELLVALHHYGTKNDAEWLFWQRAFYVMAILFSVCEGVRALLERLGYEIVGAP